MIQKLTTEQAIVLTVMTGFRFINLKTVKQDIEKRLRREIKNEEWGTSKFLDEIIPFYQEDFNALEPKEEPQNLLVGV